jgi:hypothetical protein
MLHYNVTIITGTLRVDQYTFLYRVYKYYRVLGAFAKLRKATISFVVSVRLPAWNNSTPIRRIFMKFDVCVF